MKRLLLGVIAAFTLLVGLPATAGAQSTATVTLLHGIPGVPVDVLVNGTVVVPNFQPGATQDLSSFAGQTLTNIEVRPVGSTTAVITVPSLTVPSSGNWTVIAYLDATGTPTIKAFQNDVSPVPAGDGRIIVRHTAQAPAVDVVAGTARPITDLSNGEEAVLVLPAGTLSGLQLAPTGGAPIVDVPSVNLVAGSVLIVYAVGSISAQPPTFTFYTQQIVVTELPPTGAGQVLAQTGVAVLAVLAGAGLLLLARRRPLAA